MQLLLLLPVLLLFVAAGAILVLRRFQPGFGYAWLLAVVASMTVWGLLVYFRIYTPAPVIFINWLPVTQTVGTVIFQLDTPAWVYTMSLAGLAVAVTMTASARLQHNSNPSTWAANLAITAAGMLATLAGTPLALVLAWTVIDAIELAFILGAVREKETSAEAVLAFSFRITGTLVLLGTMVLSQATGQELLLIDPRPDLSILLLIAAGLRLGVLPLHLPYIRELPFRRGVSTTLRLVSAASGLVVLGRLPVTVVSQVWYPWMLLFAAMAAFYGAVMWLTSPNEIRGRPYWMIALGGLAVVSVVRGYPTASLAWGSLMILGGSLLFLYSVREMRLIFLPALGALAFSGLPFTPGGVGWQGLVVFPINYPDFIFWGLHALLLVGFIRHIFRPEETLSALERWIKVVYPLGLGLLAGTAWLVAVLGWTDSRGLDRWWASLAAVIAAVGGTYAFRRLQPWWVAHPERTAWVTVVSRPILRVSNALLRLDWLYLLVGIAYRLSQALVRALTVILEGEGGVLWVLVLLALLVSLLMTNLIGGP
jgi:hypothetical protein